MFRPTKIEKLLLLLSRLNKFFIFFTMFIQGIFCPNNNDAKSAVSIIFIYRKLQLVSHPPYGSCGVERDKTNNN